MKSGIDFGSSLVKAVWLHNGEFKFFSTANTPLEEIIKQLTIDNVKKINAAGIGYSNNLIDYFKNFEIKMPEGDLIDNEIKLQAKGTKLLLEKEKYPINDFLIISIGTGISYTFVTNNEIIKFPIGNSLGGGFINGLGKILGITNYNELTIKPTEGTPLDLCIKDVIPNKTGTFEGELVIANFGKGDHTSEKSAVYSSLISTVAVTIIRDVLLLNMMSNFPQTNNLVYIGSTIAHAPFLKKLLQKYSTMFGKNSYFPKQSEFALALGAYYSSD